MAGKLSPPESPDDLLTAEQAGRALGISAQRVGVLCVEGRVPGAQKVGRAWVIRRAGLEAIRERLPGRPTTEAVRRDVAEECARIAEGIGVQVADVTGAQLTPGQAAARRIAAAIRERFNGE